ncbi:hypothetical protein BKA70DRAFT_1255705 [Coprinopsis sp. MPI-PUGE-AT-0042]|nr:hypothetical protein BKA70DRAFT_1255705 [Coprinopsis sp. MPI-PUGE-AT-0042]
MSFIKKLSRKVGGRLPKIKHDRRSEDSGSKSREDDEGEQPGFAEVATRAEPGSPLKSALAQTVSISGGTFTDVYIGSQTNIQNVFEAPYSNDSKLFVMLNPVAAAHDCQEVTSKISECFAGTRQQLLQDIEKWRTSNSSTVCARADAERRLAASWFFSRDQQDRKSTRGFVATLAFQLASYHPALRDQISQALRDHPDILQKSIRAQFDALIHKPLQAVLRELGGTHAMSIDAIDECCDLNEATEILWILLTIIPQHPQIRLLVTCRPERAFRLLLQKHRGPQVFHLHEIENSVVESDIRLYINYRLSPEQVDDALPDLLPPPWRASAKEKEALVQMAGKLFIIASTAVNFILDPMQLAPGKQIRQLLDAMTGSGPASSPMDCLYTQVLRSAIPTPTGDWFEDYQCVVGAIVVAADVLPVHSLALLLDKEPNDIVRTLSHLHSLVAPTNHDEAFRVHHKSFPDFVTDPARCSIDPRLFIDAPAQHLRLARDCLRIMTQMLKHNICGIPVREWSKSVPHISIQIRKHIPPQLAYACAHFVYHLEGGLPRFSASRDDLVRLKALVDEHLLPWLKVLAFIGRFDSAWHQVNLLSNLLSTIIPQSLPTSQCTASNDLSHIVSVLQDCQSFLTLHPDLPRLYPMHIYLSSLPFTPTESLIRKLYAKWLPRESFSITSKIDRTWNPVHVPCSIKQMTYDMKFSPSGEMIAIASDRIRLYNVKSGGQIREFASQHDSQEHRHDTTISFSADGSLIAGSNTYRAQVWDAASGAPIVTFDIPQSHVPQSPAHSPENQRGPTSISFNRPGTALVVGTPDGRVFLWQMEGKRQAQVLRTLKHQWNHGCDCPPEGPLEMCLNHDVEDLWPVPDSETMVIITGQAVQFWALDPPQLLNSIARRVTRNEDTCFVSASMDSTLLAVECNPCVIKVFMTSNGDSPVATLSGHERSITTMTFAHNAEELCSSSLDMTVRIWNIETSTQVMVLPTAYDLSRSDVLYAAFLDAFVFVGEKQILQLDTDVVSVIGKGPPIIDLIRLSTDRSTLAIYAPESTTLSTLQGLIESSANGLLGTASSGSPLTISFLPTGELLTICGNSTSEDESEVSVCNQITEETVTLKLMVKGANTITPDATRVATVGQDCRVSVHNLHSGRLEAYLEPLDKALLQRGVVLPTLAFSWDSGSVYVQREDGLHAALLPCAIGGGHDLDPAAPCALPASFSRYKDMPTLYLPYLQGGSAPPIPWLDSLAGGEAWVLEQDGRRWKGANLTSLPRRIAACAYSPGFQGVAVVGGQDGAEPHEIVNPVVELRTLPDYSLVASFPFSHSIENSHHMKLRFPASFPHILVTSSPSSLASWDTSTMLALGSYRLAYPTGNNIHFHAYSPTNFICLVDNEDTTRGLVAVSLRGALPALVHHICRFPSALAIGYRAELHVNPCHPHRICVSARSGTLHMDISNVPFPFTLY